LGAIALGACVLATACLPKPGLWSGDGDGPRVFITGDSVMHAAQNGPGVNANDTLITDPLENQPNRYRTAISTLIGSRTNHLNGLSSYSSEEGRTSGGVYAPGADIGVSNHGANDARTDANTGMPTLPVATSIANMEQYISDLNATCFAVIGLPEPDLDQLPTTWGHEGFATTWNDYWEARDQQSADIVYGDWDAVVDASVNELLQTDLIHPTEDGRAAFRALVIDSVNRCASDNGLEPGA
jgi:hypothetical protein